MTVHLLDTHPGRHRAHPSRPHPLRALLDAIDLLARWWNWPPVQAYYYRRYKRADRKALAAEMAALPSVSGGEIREAREYPWQADSAPDEDGLNRYRTPMSPGPAIELCDFHGGYGELGDCTPACHAYTHRQAVPMSPGPVPVPFTGWQVPDDYQPVQVLPGGRGLMRAGCGSWLTAGQPVAPDPEPGPPVDPARPYVPVPALFPCCGHCDEPEPQPPCSQPDSHQTPCSDGCNDAPVYGQAPQLVVEPDLAKVMIP